MCPEAIVEQNRQLEIFREEDKRGTERWRKTKRGREAGSGSHQDFWEGVYAFHLNDPPPLRLLLEKKTDRKSGKV